MEQLIGQINSQLPYYLLLFVRMSGLFILSPIFGRKNIPAMLKIGFSVLLTLILGTATVPTGVQFDDHLLGYVLPVLGELAVGLSLGFVAAMFFSATLIAGQIIDVEMGLGIGGVFDPGMNTNAAVSGVFLNLMMLLYFLLNNGHLRLIRILAASVDLAPVGQVTLSPDLALLGAQQFTLAFGLAVSLMLPLIGAALLTETGMGLLMRAIPQLNAYMVGIPLKVLVGLFVLTMLQPVYVIFCDKVFNEIYAASGRWISQMGGAA